MKLFSIAFALAFVAHAASSICTNDPIRQDPRHDFQFFAGYSPVAPTVIGTTTDRTFLLLGFSYSYRCWAWRKWSINYTAGIMPIATLFQPTQQFLTGFGQAQVTRIVPKHAVYGFGTTPLGLSAEFARTHKWHPFLLGDVGVIASTEPIPENVTNATGLNFLFDLGGGLKWQVDDKRALSFGYRFLHISNAGTTTFNPGVDNSVLYIGFSVLHQ